MIYIDTASEDIYYNFAVEEYFSAEKDLGDSIFLLWRTPPMLVMGQFQSIYREVDMAYAQENHIGIARRRSGGGAVYLDEGAWLYTYWFPRTTYADIDFQKNSAGVVDALRKLGLNISFSGRNDILADGKKICGNARYCVNGGVLHHGTLLFSTDMNVLSRALTPDKEKIQSKGVRSVRSRVANISDLLNSSMDSNEFGQYMIKEVTKDCVEYQMTQEDLIRIREIADRYRSWEWIYGKEPKFQFRREKRLPGGLLSVGVDVQNGRVAELEINGDFFCRGSMEEFKRLFAGQKFDRETFLSCVQTGCLDADHFFDQISFHDFLDIVFGEV